MSDNQSEDSKPNPEEAKAIVFKNIVQAFENNNPSEAQLIIEAYVDSQKSLVAEESLLQGKEEGKLEGAQLALKGAAHELGTTLGLATGYSELLAMDKDLPSDKRDLAVSALDGIQRTNTLLDQFRNITQFKTVDSPVGPMLDVKASASVPLLADK